MNSTRTQSQLFTSTLISCLCLVFIFHFGYCLCKSPHLFKKNLVQVITWVTEWINTYGIHHWRSFRSRYRKSAWERFEPTTTGFCWDTWSDRAVRSWTNFTPLLFLHLYIQFDIYIYIYIYIYINSFWIQHTQCFPRFSYFSDLFKITGKYKKP